MGDVCGPIGERHGRDVCSNWREALKVCMCGDVGGKLDHTSLPCLSFIGPHVFPMPLSYWTTHLFHDASLLTKRLHLTM